MPPAASPLVYSVSKASFSFCDVCLVECGASVAGKETLVLCATSGANVWVGARSRGSPGHWMAVPRQLQAKPVKTISTMESASSVTATLYTKRRPDMD